MTSIQTSLGALALLATAASAQQTIQPTAITGPVKDAGTYHVATGTWTRGAGGQANLGPDVLYNNNAPTGFYGLMSNPHHWVDNGRIPSTGGHANATSDTYTVNGFQSAYCTSEGTAGTSLTWAFYNQYAACTDHQVLSPVAAFLCSACPGSSSLGTTACWIVTFDLQGTTLEFGMDGDADGIYDGIASLDDAGLLFSINAVNGNCGPILMGDPLNFPMGDGTYFQNPGLTGTGLDTADQFWIFDTTGTLGTGCYWFGGYVNGAPYGSFWWQLYGEGGGGGGCAEYCTSNANSAGGDAKITVDSGCGTDTIGVTATPVPNQPGIFFTGTSQLNVPFGNGVLCTGGSITRNGVVVGAANSASDTVSRPGYTPGGTNVQFWFRDPAGGGAFFNTSSARVMD